MTDLVRPEGDRDPENVDDAIREFSDELQGDGGDHVALREMFYHLRRNKTAGSRELRSAATEELSDSLAAVYTSESEWWSSTGSQYLALLPGIIPPEGTTSGGGYLARLSRAVPFGDSDSTMWRYVETTQERPTVPEEPTVLPDEYLKEAVDDIAPDEGQTPTSKIQLRKLYHHLVENETATSEELKALYETSRHDQPEYGSYEYASDWFREVGRECLAQLPGIDPPRIAGDDWRHVGVDPEELGVLESEAAGVSDEEIDDRLAEIDVAGHGEWADRRRETVRKMYEHLREEGSVTPDEFRSNVDADAVGFSSAESFLSRVGYDALASLPGANAPGKDGGRWEYGAES